MIETSLEQIIKIYSWIIASFIMIFIAAIAMFYQKKFGVKTFYYFYLVPIIFLFAVVINLYSFNTPESEFVEFIGVFISFIATYYLYRIMVRVK